MTHTHPKPIIDFISQSISLAGLVAIGLSIPAFIGLVMAGAPGGFLLAIPVMAALGLPLIMRLSITPPITCTPTGFSLHPRYGQTQTLTWADVVSVAHFPLLPTEDTEVVRRATVGRDNYAPAQGIMLVIPALSWRYRVGGFFAGAGGQPIIALTNRSHRNYEALVQAVYAHTNQTAI